MSSGESNWQDDAAVAVARAHSPGGRCSRWAPLLAALLATFACSLLACASASALSHRGHAFALSFGSEGEGDGQFDFAGKRGYDEAPGIAVDESTGDVYVVDRGNDRVEQFGPLGEFISTWGWGVANGEEKFEVCESACRKGLAGSGKGEFKEPEAIAVDNSHLITDPSKGDVYVQVNGSSARPNVERFGVSRQPLVRLRSEEEGRLEGIAVDGAGHVWLYRGGEELEGSVEGFSDAERPTALEQHPSFTVECPQPGFAVDGAADTFYVDRELENGEEECPLAAEKENTHHADGAAARASVADAFAGTAEEPSIDGIDRDDTTGLAVEAPGGPSGGAVYLDNVSSVAAFTSGGALIQRFGDGDLQHGGGIAVNSETGYVYVVDAAADRVDVFAPELPGKPLIDGVWAQTPAPGGAADPHTAQLNAEIDPSGEATHWLFEYGTVDCAVDPSGCKQEPAAPGSEIEPLFGDQHESVEVEGLEPGTTYHYRLVAANASGEAEGPQTFGTLTVPPEAAGVLADDRAWELVSPVEKDGSAVEPIALEGAAIQADADGSAIAYAADGPVVAEPASNRAPEATTVLSVRGSEAWSSQDLATPHEKGEGLEAGEPPEYRLFSSDLALSIVQPPLSKEEPLEAPPLALGQSEKTVYVRDDAPKEPGVSEQAAYDGARANGEAEAYAEAQAAGRTITREQAQANAGYLPLVSAANDTAGTAFGGKLNFVDATPDLDHAILESDVPLTLGATSEQIYEWEAGGAIQPVGVLPDGVPAVEPKLGFESTDVRHAISEDGSRVFWAENSEGPHRLYMRDVPRKLTIQVNAAQGVVEPEPEESEVAFETASAGGERVFFTDTAPLTPESGQRPVPGERNPADLYECEIVEEAGSPSCRLKDLTAVAAGGGADVLNVIPGASADGSYVYFVANGVLAPGAEPGDCIYESSETAQPGAGCNLYEWHEGSITFIARLSNQDSGDWGSLHGSGRVGEAVQPRPDLADVTSSVSANGEYLAFMSQMPLTGYDNTDELHPGVRDEEVYVYDAASDLLTCVSCKADASGEPVPSRGVLDVERSGEGKGLRVDRREDWTGEYLAGSIPGWDPLGDDQALYQPRYLSNSGRLFFDSPDDLVPSATNEKEDVYEYEPAGVGTCAGARGCISLISSGTAPQESAFLDASESGDDVFFVTAQALVAADQDDEFDLYDAHVCSAASPCLRSTTVSSPSCEASSTCRPGTTSQPPPSVPVSATFSGPGSTPQQGVLPSIATKPKPLTRAQQLAKALKSCRRDRKRKKRVACEAQAHRRYGQKKPTAGKQSAKQVKR